MPSSFTHANLWRALDEIADQNGLSPSGLAKLAGLDATAFNLSKRFNKDGRERWPSTESLAKVLDATQTSIAQFQQILDRPKGP